MNIKATIWVLNPQNSVQWETFIHLPVVPTLRLRQGDHELLQPGLRSETLSQQRKKRKEGKMNGRGLYS